MMENIEIKKKIDTWQLVAGYAIVTLGFIFATCILKEQGAFKACKDVFRGVSLLLKAERGYTVFATRSHESVALIRTSFNKPKAEQYLKKSSGLFCINMVS